MFPARELLATDEVRARAAQLVGEQPWGREQWERLAEGLVFDGMESWLPWLTPEEHLLTDVLPRHALVVLVEPRRLRDRAADVVAEEDDLARTLAVTWGAGLGEAFPRLHLDPDRLLERVASAALSLVNVPESPDTPTVAASAWAGGLGWPPPPTAPRSASVCAGCSARATASSWRPTAPAPVPGWPRLLRDVGVDLELDEAGRADLTKPGGRIVVAPLLSGFVLPGLKLAVLTEADLTGRRRSHRAPRPRSRDSGRFFEDLKPGDFIVHYHHGVGRYGGMVQRSIGGVERDYLLLEYKGGDKLYVPSDQIDAVRHYVGGEAPALHRLGGSDFARAKGRVRQEVRRIAQELVVLYQKRLSTPGHAFSPDTPWQQELEASFPFVETPDQLKAIDDVKLDMEAERPMDRLVCGDVGFGKTEVAIRAAFKAMQDGKQVAVLVPTTLLAQQHHATFSDRFAGYPVRVEVLSRFLTPGQAKARDRRHRVGRRRPGDRHPPPAVGRHPLQEPRAAGGRRGAALRRHPQGGDEAAVGRGRRADAHRHAHPPHPGDEPHRHPRPDAAEHAARRSPAHPHLRRRVRRSGRGRGHPARAAARGPGLLRAQPGAGHRDGRRPSPRPRPRGADRHRPRPDGRGHPRAGRRRLLGGQVRRPALHHHHRERHRHADGEHARGRPRRPASGSGSSTSCAVGSAGPGSGPTPTCSTPRTACSPRRPTSGSAPSARPPSWARASRSPSATSRSGGRATCWARARAATSPRSATTSTARWSTRPSPR